MKKLNKNLQNIVKCKFKLGQKVYLLKPINSYHECSLCKGTGQVTIDKKKYTCPSCYGEKKILDKNLKWVVKGPRKITHIDVAQYYYVHKNGKNKKFTNIIYTLDEMDDVCESSNVLYCTQTEALKAAKDKKILKRDYDQISKDDDDWA